MKISNRLHEMRMYLELTQSEIAEKFQITLGTWKQYERGPSEPGSWALASLAKGGVNIHWVLTGEGAMFVGPVSEATLSYRDRVDVLSGKIADLVHAETASEKNACAAQDAVLLAQHRMFGAEYIHALMIGRVHTPFPFTS